jgi:hypothetical protein
VSAASFASPSTSATADGSPASAGGKEFQSGWVDDQPSMWRDLRSCQRRVRGSTVPSLSLGRRECRARGGHRGGTIPVGTNRQCRCNGRPRPRSRVVAGRWDWAQGTGGAAADERGARAVLRLAGARVDGGLRAQAWVGCAARVRRWVRIWSITDGCVMKATRRIAPRQVGQPSGSTSKICWSSAAHRRVASVGASRRAGTIAGGPAAVASAAFPRGPRGRFAYQP